VILFPAIDKEIVEMVVSPAYDVSWLFFNEDFTKKVQVFSSIIIQLKTLYFFNKFTKKI
jgi:hypothetical protein